MMRWLFFLLVLLIVDQATAQTIEFEVPTSYDLVPGRLEVVLPSGTTEADARALLAQSGYRALTVSSPPATLLVALAAQVDPGLLDALANRPEISSARPTCAVATFPCSTPGLEVTASAGVSGERLEATVLAITEAQVVRLKAPGVSVTVAVPEGDEEAAVARLEALPGVAYVSYLVADAP